MTPSDTLHLFNPLYTTLDYLYEGSNKSVKKKYLHLFHKKEQNRDTLEHIVDKLPEDTICSKKDTKKIIIFMLFLFSYKVGAKWGAKNNIDPY